MAKNEKHEMLIDAIKAGQTECLEQLWHEVEWFVRKKAAEFTERVDRSDDLEDCMQEAFLILPEAVAYYDQAAKKSFLGVLASWYLPKTFKQACFGGRTKASFKDPINSHESIYSMVSINEDYDLQLVDLLVDENTLEYQEAVTDAVFWESVDRYLRKGIKALRRSKDRMMLRYMLDNNCGYGECYEVKLIGDKSRQWYWQVCDRALKDLRRWMETDGSPDRIRLGIDDFIGTSIFYNGGISNFVSHGFTSNVERLAVDGYPDNRKPTTSERLAEMLKCK
jgi:hypothetical protein